MHHFAQINVWVWGVGLDRDAPEPGAMPVCLLNSSMQLQQSDCYISRLLMLKLQQQRPVTSTPLFLALQAPDVMRSCSMALQLLSTAVGSYLGGGLVAAVAAATSAAGSPWLPKDLNTGHLDLFLWLCGGLMLANTLLFVLVANGYEYKVGGTGSAGGGARVCCKVSGCCSSQLCYSCIAWVCVWRCSCGCSSACDQGGIGLGAS